MSIKKVIRTWKVRKLTAGAAQVFPIPIGWPLSSSQYSTTPARDFCDPSGMIRNVSYASVTYWSCQPQS